MVVNDVNMIAIPNTPKINKTCIFGIPRASKFLSLCANAYSEPFGPQIQSLIIQVEKTAKTMKLAGFEPFL